VLHERPSTRELLVDKYSVTPQEMARELAQRGTCTPEELAAFADGYRMAAAALPSTASMQQVAAAAVLQAGGGALDAVTEDLSAYRTLVLAGGQEFQEQAEAVQNVLDNITDITLAMTLESATDVIEDTLELANDTADAFGEYQDAKDPDTRQPISPQQELQGYQKSFQASAEREITQEMEKIEANKGAIVDAARQENLVGGNGPWGSSVQRSSASRGFRHSAGPWSGSINSRRQGTTNTGIVDYARATNFTATRSSNVNSQHAALLAERKRQLQQAKYGTAAAVSRRRMSPEEARAVAEAALGAQPLSGIGADDLLRSTAGKLHESSHGAKREHETFVDMEARKHEEFLNSMRAARSAEDLSQALKRSSESVSKIREERDKRDKQNAYTSPTASESGKATSWLAMLQSKLGSLTKWIMRNPNMTILLTSLIRGLLKGILSTVARYRRLEASLGAESKPWLLTVYDAVLRGIQAVLSPLLDYIVTPVLNFLMQSLLWGLNKLIPYFSIVADKIRDVMTSLIASVLQSHVQESLLRILFLAAPAWGHANSVKPIIALISDISRFVINGEPLAANNMTRLFDERADRRIAEAEERRRRIEDDRRSGVDAYGNAVSVATPSFFGNYNMPGQSLPQPQLQPQPQSEPQPEPQFQPRPQGPMSPAEYANPYSLQSRLGVSPFGAAPGPMRPDQTPADFANPYSLQGSLGVTPASMGAPPPDAAVSPVRLDQTPADFANPYSLRGRLGMTSAYGVTSPAAAANMTPAEARRAGYRYREAIGPGSEWETRPDENKLGSVRLTSNAGTEHNYASTRDFRPLDDVSSAEFARLREKVAPAVENMIAYRNSNQLGELTPAQRERRDAMLWRYAMNTQRDFEVKNGGTDDNWNGRNPERENIVGFSDAYGRKSVLENWAKKDAAKTVADRVRRGNGYGTIITPVEEALFSKEERDRSKDYGYGYGDARRLENAGRTVGEVFQGMY
jgi:hypothetical protein